MRPRPTGNRKQASVISIPSPKPNKSAIITCARFLVTGPILKTAKPKNMANSELAWVAYIGGKRGVPEDHRRSCAHPNGYPGRQNRIRMALSPPPGPSTCISPDPLNKKYFEGQEFFAGTKHIRVAPYTIPYRCLYSEKYQQPVYGRTEYQHHARGVWQYPRNAHLWYDGRSSRLCRLCSQ